MQFLVLTPISLGSIRILFSDIHVHVSLFPVGLTVSNLSTPTFLHSDYMTCPPKSSRFNHFIILSESTNYEVPPC